jgi:hypothetical protein
MSCQGHPFPGRDRRAAARRRQRRGRDRRRPAPARRCGAAGRPDRARTHRARPHADPRDDQQPLLPQPAREPVQPGAPGRGGISFLGVRLVKFSRVHAHACTCRRQLNMVRVPPLRGTGLFVLDARLVFGAGRQLLRRRRPFPYPYRGPRVHGDGEPGHRAGARAGVRRHAGRLVAADAGRVRASSAPRSTRSSPTSSARPRSW